jgi:NAD(P)-binding Rossmann-like domain
MSAFVGTYGAAGLLLHTGSPLKKGKKKCSYRAPLPAPVALRRTRVTSQLEVSEDVYDVVIIGSGFGGLCCAAATTALGFKTLVLESHYAPGGVAHGFEVKGNRGVFKFDTGPSFYCGLDSSGNGCSSVNPVKVGNVHRDPPCEEGVTCRL